MAQTAAQLVALACETAACPGFIVQAGQRLNLILDELCRTYDFDAAKGTFNFVFDPGKITTQKFPNITLGGGPYDLPADFLRMVDEKDNMWFLLGVPYPMKPCDLSEYDNLVQQAGNNAYPYIFATDMSTAPPNGANATMVVWPPPSGAYSGMLRYRRLMPDIASPESSNVIPWFPYQNYLLKRLTGEMMQITGDPRAAELLGDKNPEGAQAILNRYLKLADDKSDRAETVKLDRRRFGRSFTALPNTKTVGW